ACLLMAGSSFAQTPLDSLKREIMNVKLDVEHINMNLAKSKAKFQRGIAVATIGYSITIAGGLMLGREKDELGQAMLIAGGVTGATGTFLLVDAFKFLGRTRRNGR
ncbi:hypothetical protein, partial [Fulvivirga aurantia]|uniref:hypothetical protein n=1 Tax=Fulvivirga aurantia TaxID=2529383 RepID=UPI001625A192